MITSVQANLPCFVLAGGQSTRFDGNDKSWLLIGQQTMLECTLKSWLPQVKQVIINPPQITPRYKQLATQYNTELVLQQKFLQQGPLSGILNALTWAKLNQYEHVLTCPIDMPKVPTNAAVTMLEVYKSTPCQAVIAKDSKRHHHCLGIWSTTLIADMQQQLQQQHNKITDFLATIHWSSTQISSQPIININRSADIESLVKTKSSKG